VQALLLFAGVAAVYCMLGGAGDLLLPCARPARLGDADKAHATACCLLKDELNSRILSLFFYYHYTRFHQLACCKSLPAPLKGYSPSGLKER
jgi:hypothetical protein